MKPKPDLITRAQFVALATGYYTRRLDHLSPSEQSKQAAFNFRLVQRGLAAVVPGTQKRHTPGWYASCLRGHQQAARVISGGGR